MKKTKTIVKSIVWPVLFGIGQIIISAILFFLFRAQKVASLSSDNTQSVDLLFQNYLNSTQGQASFSTFMNQWIWVVIAINLLVFLPILLKKYKSYTIINQKIKKNSVPTIIGLTISLSLFLNLILSLLDTSGRYEVKSIEWVLLLSTAIVGPILEEIVFRGIAYETLKKGFYKKTAMILVTILFALFHGSFYQIIYAACMGSLFLFFLEKYKSIYASILAHSISNLVVAIGIPLLMMCSLPIKVILSAFFLFIFILLLHKTIQKT